MILDKPQDFAKITESGQGEFLNTDQDNWIYDNQSSLNAGERIIDIGCAVGKVSKNSVNKAVHLKYG